MSANSQKIKKLTTLAVLSALAFICVLVCRIPITTIDFLKYEPKDVIITIGGFIYGPLAAFGMSLVVSLIEMVTISSTGIWGFIMNVLSTCAFACTASLFYKKFRTMGGAAAGLVAGTLVSTGMMILWNWAITPIYMGYPRDAVAAMLVPVFLPFNLIKGGLNAAFTLLLYKPAVTALRQAKLIEKSSGNPVKKGVTAGVVITSLVLVATLILIVLGWKGII